MTDDAKVLSDLLGTDVTVSEHLSGGDVSEVIAIDTPRGPRVAKSSALPGVEARTLQAIAAAGCPAAQVVATSDKWLVMDRLPQGFPTKAGWAEAGHAICDLHATVGPHFGWKEDFAIGPAPQPAIVSDDWPAFWAEHRLLAWPETLPADIAQRLERLAARLPDLLPRQPRASLLHGDLWHGNLVFDSGFKGLIDPACYYGDAEVDLAALTTFGMPPAEFFAAYGPCPEGWEHRRPIYRLWIAILHLRLFGESYRGMVERCLQAAGA